MDLTALLAIENADKQAIALKYNPQAFLSVGELLKTSEARGDELWLVQNHALNGICQEKEMYFLRMVCPTGRIFIEGVDPKVAKEVNFDPVACQAHAFRRTLAEYSNLRLEG